MKKQNLEYIIQHSLEQNKVNHCYLLKSYEKVNFDKSILFIINALNKSNLKNLNQENLPANIVVFNKSDNGNLALEKEEIVKQFELTSLSTFQENQYKFLVFENIDQASNAALNSLLKTIENPSKNVIFILTTNKFNKVLSTIKSRSMIINIPSTNKKEIEKKLLNNNLSPRESYLFAQIFTDTKQILSTIKPYTLDTFLELKNVVENSFKNPYFLYAYLIQYLKKDTKQDFLNLIYALKYFYSLSWNAEKNEDEELKNLAKKMKNANFDLYDCFIVISDFLNNQDSNLNFFLQAEKMLIKLMEIYV
ncbi:hypothetical protein [Mycoplasmopsis columbina]|uniref:hypothetical protein n=1 Tax=Mycoplasmopsis columbina TaxID=114881 RepID=UPI0004A70A6A|nr:hypothetical protein [Mycoplasmopsis columbina]VEU76991.1 DNA polymerase III subunit delta [Mycoplasmopsis columbina]